MTTLFGRYATLKIGIPGTRGKLIESLSFDKEGNIVQGLHFTFRIEKTAEPSPNKSQIDIYNLSENTRSLLSTKGAAVILEAGYGGILSNGKPVSEVIFKGDVVKSKTTKRGPDYITTIENGDGIAAYQNSNFEGSFAAGSQVSNIVDSVIASFGLGKGEVSGVDGQVLNGATYSGSSRDVMNDLAGKTGTEWSIQNGLVQMVPINKFTDMPAVMLNSIGNDKHGNPIDINTGLINSPTLSGFNNSKDKKYSGVEFTALLQPGLMPGRRVLIHSKFVPKGMYIVRKVTHNGDTRSGPWYSECEAVAPPVSA